MKIEQHFYELLQVAIGNRNVLTACPGDEEWAMLYDMAKKQALVGIAFKGIERLPAEQRPPMMLFLKWSGMAIKTKEKNLEVSQKCVEVTQKFIKDGFVACVLKGQGNFPAIRGTEVEVHIRPSFLCSPVRNRRLQRWFVGERFMVNGSGFMVNGSGFTVHG